MNLLVIGAQTIRDRLKDFDGDIEARVRFAMARAWTDDTWYTGDADEKLRAALGGALMSLDEYTEDYGRLERSVRLMKTMTAMFAGVPVNLDAIDADGVLPLVTMWEETCAKEKARWSR